MAVEGRLGGVRESALKRSSSPISCAAPGGFGPTVGRTIKGAGHVAAFPSKPSVSQHERLSFESLDGYFSTGTYYLSRNLEARLRLSHKSAANMFKLYTLCAVASILLFSTGYTSPLNYQVGFLSNSIITDSICANDMPRLILIV